MDSHVVALALIVLFAQIGVIAPDCVRRTTHRDLYGTIHDGKDNYKASSVCEWLIEAPTANATIALSFTQYKTECGYDFVYVYDGDSYRNRLLASLSGDGLPPTLRARSGKMLVVLYSDANYALSGFVAHYAVEKCPYECSNAGQCVSGVCRCRYGFYGDGCEIDAFPKNCSGHGRRNATAMKCDCDEGFIGESCSFDDNEGSWNYKEHTWFTLSTRRDVFTPRMSHAGVYLSTTDTVWVYGGYDAYEIFGDLLVYNVKASEWRIVKNATRGPGPRFGHTVVLWQNRLLLFGGQISTKSLTNELWQFDVNTSTWQCLVESNCTDCPKPIAGHAACMVENRMFIYGGYSPQSGFTSRLWSYDVITGKWRKEPGSGTKSSRRRVVAHSMVYHSESKQIVIFGGYTSDKLLWSKRSSALLIYHTQFQYWTLEDAEDNPVEFGRASHSGTLFGNYLLIYGGGLHQHHVREECYSPNIHAYHLGCHKWTARTASSAFSSRSQPRGRIAHIGVKRDDGTLLVIGGFYGVASSDVLALRVSANLTDRPTPKTNQTHCDSMQTEDACTDDPQCFWCGSRTAKCQHYLLKSTCREPMQTNPCPDACIAAHNKCENCLRGVSWWPEDDPVQCGWCVQEQRCYRVNETRGRCRESASTFWWGRAQFLTAFDDCAVRDQPPALSRVCYKEPYNDSDPDLVGLIFSSQMEVFPEFTLEDQNMNTKCVARGYLRPQLLPVGSVAKEYRVRLFVAEIISATFKLGDEEAVGDIVIGESGGVSDPKEIVARRSSGMPVLPATIAEPNQTFPSYYFEMTEVVKNYHSNFERRKKPKAIWLQSNVNLDVFFNGTHLSPLTTTNVSRDYLESYASGSCAQHANCMSCVSDASCSWCNHNDQCLLRTALREDSCLRGLTSKSEYCSVCQDYNDCVSCVENGSCEWLDSHKTCGRRRGLWKAITDTKHCLKPCEKSLSCDECTRSAGCIWCSHLNLCLKSTSIISRNTFGQCSTIVGQYAAFKSCSVRDCSKANDCNSCLDLVNCGWCGPVGDPSKGSCIRGDFQSAYDDRCSAFASERNITHLGNWEWSYGKCPDMRECELEKDSCHVNATCINTPDSYDCECNRGYRGDGLNCKRTCFHRCVEGVCFEAPEYECKCNVGWTGVTCNESCGCNGHSFCPRGYGLCDKCRHHTFGERCEFCLPGSYGNATDPEVGCKPCNCNNHSDAERGHCDRRTGMCYCVEGYRGDDCGKCSQGHYGNPLRGGKCYSECSGLTILPYRRFGSLGSAKGEGVLDPTTLSNCMWIITAVNQSELGSYSLNSSASLDAFYNASQSKRAKIVFHVDVLETSCFHDHVHVYDGLPDFLIPSHQSSSRKWEKLAAYCGSAKKKERAVVAHSGIMIVWYQGRGGGSSPGFNGTFEIRSCAGNCSGANEECGADDDSSACRCVTGYAGPNCDTLRCPMDCGGSLCDYARDVCSDCSSCNRSTSVGSVELFSRSTASPSSMKSGNLTSLPARTGHTMIYSATKDALYIFGGYSMQGGFCNDILKIIIHAGTWQIIEPKGVLPEGRYFHTVVERLGSLIFMGGVTARGTTDSVEYFGLDSESWHKGTKCPVSVAGHTTTRMKTPAMKTLAVLIGGYSSLSERFNRDVMVYNTFGESWQTYKAFGRSPEVFGHSTVHYSSFDRLIVYGGYTRLGLHGFTFSNALFVLSIDFNSKTSHWDEIFLDKPTFPEFGFHAAHIITESNSMLVIGGSSSSGSEALNTVFRIDCADWISEPPSSLLAVTASASVYFPDKQFAIVAGGFDGGIPIGDFVAVYPTIDPCRVLESTTCARIPGCVKCQKRKGCVSTGDPTSQCVEGTERPQSNCSMPLEPKTACSQLKSCQSCLFSQLSCHWCPCLDTCVTDEIYCSQCSAVSQIEQCPAPVQLPCTKLTNSRDCVAQSDCTWKQQSCANSTGDSPCSQKTTCADCAGADGCAWSSGLKTCLPEVELPLACIFGRCERVALAPTECPRSCARNTHCRACIQDLGCGWCAKPDGSGNGTCTEGTIDGSTSDVQCDLSSNVSSAVFGFWSYMKCPKEDECRNNHHTCRSDQICKNTDDSFDCQCNDGYEEDPGRDRCIPACKQLPCEHGICVRPEECECEFGYVGAACDKKCDCNSAGHCSDESTEGLKNCTECRNNTRGPQCSQCNPFYVGRLGNCVPCRDVCYKNSDVCVDKEQIKRLDLSLSLTQSEVESVLNLTRGPDQSNNVVCLSCRNHSRGDRCDECVEGYFNEAGIVSRRKIVGCRPCFCNGHSSRCDAKTGLRCQCSNHTRTQCDETNPLCYRYQCAECAASYMGNATDGFPCYEKVAVGVLKQVSSGAQSRLFGIWPSQVNVDIHLTIWILNGTSDVYVGTGNHDVRLTVDRRTGAHAARFTTDSYKPVSGGGGDDDDDYKPTVVRMLDIEDRLFLRQFRGQLRVIIPYASFRLQSQKFFVALLGTSDDYRSFVYFRQDSPEINLFIFFSVFFSGFFLFLAFCVLVWKLKQEMDRRRMVHQEAIEMEERKRRPTGKTSFLCEREIPIAGRFKFSSKRSVVVSPVAVQSTDDGRARVGTFLFQLPGSPFDPMNISLASALLAKSFRDVRRSSVDYFPIADRSRRLKRVSAV